MRRDVRAAVALAALWCSLAAPAPSRASESQPSEREGAAAEESDAEREAAASAPVLLGGEPVVWIFAGMGRYTPEVRAARITERLEAIVHDAGITDPVVTVVEAAGSSELRVQTRMIMVVTPRDAAVAGVSHELLAAEAARMFEAAIRAERLRYAPATLARSSVYALVATLLLAILLWIVVRLTAWIHRKVGSWRRRWLESLRLEQTDFAAAEHLTRGIELLARLLRLALVLVALHLYLTFVLRLFPWTRAVSLRLLEYLLEPVRYVAVSLIGYIPNLLFVLVIAVTVHLLIRLVALFFSQIQHGRLSFPSFPADWAEPTNKIARVLLVAFGVVIAFPYLPASDSPAFAGVSVFMGILISLASSSALSNAIAGLVLMYTGAFRIGDRVRVGESFGDIIETAVLATRVRTIKNEEVTIPNAIVLNSAVTNYSREAHSHGLILHTNITIGYDTPWRRVHELLLQAARSTPRILAEPAPFVWQTALNDFYVTYEINAYTADAPAMIDTYAELHARIQDTFFAAGVEILSPHYASLRDGNTVAIPEPLRAPGYEPAGFRVTSAPAAPSAAGPAQVEPSAAAWDPADPAPGR